MQIRRKLSNSLSKSLWQPMCHRTRISIPPCQGGESLSALYAVRPAKVNWRKPPQHFAELHESSSKTKATGQPSARIMMRTSFEQAIRPNIFRARPRANFATSENKMSFAESEEACWRAKTKSSTRSRKTPFESGCSRDASRWSGG